MEEEVKLEVFDKREKISFTLYAKPLAENRFRMTENEICDCRLTYGTEFETRINSNGKHEVIKITKESPFISRSFYLNPAHKESDYKKLGEELIENGGFWQVDFGGIVTINIPPNSTFNIDEKLIKLGMQLTEIID